MNLEALLLVVLVLTVVVEGIAILAISIEVGQLSLWIDPSKSKLPLVPNEGVKRGEAIPTPEVKRFPDGRRVRLDDRPGLIVFISSSCEPCRELWPALHKYQEEVNSQLQVVAVVGDDPLGFPAPAPGVDTGPALVMDTDASLASRWGVRRTPFAFLVADGRVRGKGVVNRYEQLVALVAGHGWHGSGEWSDTSSQDAG